MPSKSLIATAPSRTTPIDVVAKPDYPRWLRSQSPAVKAWLKDTGFVADPGASRLVPGGSRANRAIFVLPAEPGPWPWSALAASLPAGAYRMQAPFRRTHLARLGSTAALGWALAAYRFTRYAKTPAEPRRLVWPKGVDRRAVRATIEAISLVRDLINPPAGALGPAELAAAARKLGRAHACKVAVIVGDKLLAENYPTIHAVGRAADAAPRLIDMKWGNSRHPKVTLVGKGVCFDSGGLDLKTAAGMRLMKKDMGGAAHALGVASMIMDAKLPVRLRVLIGAVENAVAGNAYHPGDVIVTRQKLSVEVGNTDAEGRLVLSDCLTEASREKPDMILDFATLTGAARVALGTEMAALFANDDELAEDILAASKETADPVWRLPLYDGYRRQLKSTIADLNNISPGGYGGAITAALFLQAFVGKGIAWAHFDLMGWNQTSRPGRPEGGEAMGLRAVAAMLEKRYR
ncbi:MAG: leucyl aminopeptidase family protein, partial [Alphaproteobacteria bacterium]|nr:leucyl aminopeptidase family protein [Alphaproteobacteria bacterium]